MRRILGTVGVLTWVLMQPDSTAAQWKSTLSGDARCKTCRIELRRELVLGDSIEGLNRWPWSIKRDPNGRFYVLQPDIGDVPIVFDAKGSLVQRLGKIGDGPGEYRAAATVAFGLPDTMFIVDRRHRRVSVLDGEFRFVRSFPVVGSVFDVLWMPPALLVVNSYATDRDRFGQPLHVIDQSGRYLRSFGEDRDRAVLDEPSLMGRVMAPGSGGHIWTADAGYRYRVQLWDSTGGLLREFRRDVSWFPESDGILATLSPTSPPRPRVLGLFEDRNGLLWVFIAVSSPNWLRGISKIEREGNVGYTIDDLDEVYDTMIEIIDPGRGEVLVSQREEAALGYSMGPNLIARLKPLPSGAYVPEVWRTLLRRR